MIKKYNGPGGYYIKDSDVGPDPFSEKLLENPFNTEQFYKETWDKPEMRSDYRGLNFATESLSPKEFAGPGEIYEDMMYKYESGETESIDPFFQPKTGSERENFGRPDNKKEEKTSKKREKEEEEQEKSSRKRRGLD